MAYFELFVPTDRQLNVGEEGGENGEGKRLQSGGEGREREEEGGRGWRREDRAESKEMRISELL